MLWRALMRIYVAARELGVARQAATRRALARQEKWAKSLAGPIVALMGLNKQGLVMPSAIMAGVARLGGTHKQTTTLGGWQQGGAPSARKRWSTHRGRGGGVSISASPSPSDTVMLALVLGTTALSAVATGGDFVVRLEGYEIVVEASKVVLASRIGAL